MQQKIVFLIACSLSYLNKLIGSLLQVFQHMGGHAKFLNIAF